VLGTVCTATAGTRIWQRNNNAGLLIIDYVWSFCWLPWLPRRDGVRITGCRNRVLSKPLLCAPQVLQVCETHSDLEMQLNTWAGTWSHESCVCRIVKNDMSNFQCNSCCTQRVSGRDCALSHTAVAKHNVGLRWLHTCTSSTGVWRDSGVVNMRRLPKG
jgi:hypothetical protein